MCFDAGPLRGGRPAAGLSAASWSRPESHLFARWESADGKDRFNIEGTNQGLNTPEDDYYKRWPYPMTEQEVRSGFVLKIADTSGGTRDLSANARSLLEWQGSLARREGAYPGGRRPWPRSSRKTRVFLALMNRTMSPRTFVSR